MGNIFPNHKQIILREQRESFLNQQSKVFWLTGLSGSGKTTIGKHVEKMLFSEGYFVKLIDGDNVRDRLCKDLGFTLLERKENIRRIAEVTRLHLELGVICINTFVSPTRAIRKMAKEIIGQNDFHEVYINTTLEICEKRDVKGLYKLARKGEIQGFTGIDSPYEEPLEPQLIINTNKNIDDSSQQLYNYILQSIQA